MGLAVAKMAQDYVQLHVEVNSKSYFENFKPFPGELTCRAGRNQILGGNLIQLLLNKCSLQLSRIDAGQRSDIYANWLSCDPIQAFDWMILVT